VSLFARLLNELRQRHGLRQCVLAEKMGDEHRYISVMKVGTNGPHTEEFVERLSRQPSLPLSFRTAMPFACKK
jgi:transcriptional regulator with XRE-family HTH domain